MKASTPYDHVFHDSGIFIYDEDGVEHSLMPGEVTKLNSHTITIVSSVRSKPMSPHWLPRKIMFNNTLAMFIGLIEYCVMEDPLIMPVFLHNNTLCIIFSGDTDITLNTGYVMSIDEAIDNLYTI